jgi:hypothetical protein
LNVRPSVRWVKHHKETRRKPRLRHRDFIKARGEFHKRRIPVSRSASSPATFAVGTAPSTSSEPSSRFTTLGSDGEFRADRGLDFIFCTYNIEERSSSNSYRLVDRLAADRRADYETRKRGAPHNHS